MNIRLRNIIKIIVLIFVIFFIYFLCFINTDTDIRIIGLLISALIIAIIGYIYVLENRRDEVIKEQSNISKIILIGSEGRPDKEWSMENLKSLLIGRNIENNFVDIDLSDEVYSDYVALKHAVLNFADGIWYIEDYESVNGVGIKKNGEECAFKLKPNVLYRLDKGDVIHIAKIKLHLR